MLQTVGSVLQLIFVVLIQYHYFVLSASWDCPVIFGSNVLIRHRRHHAVLTVVIVTAVAAVFV